MEKGIYDKGDVFFNPDAVNHYNPFYIDYTEEHQSKYFNRKLNNYTRWLN